MEDKELLELVQKNREEFGVKCNKFIGSLTVEVLRSALESHGVQVSPRDVFVRGLNVEIDLLIPKTGAVPKYGILYEPQDVLAALEVKTIGSFGTDTINKTRRDFEHIRELGQDIYCAYITFTERKGFRWAVTPENLGFPAYTLFWHRADDINNGESSGDFERLISDLGRIARFGGFPEDSRGV